MICLYPRVEHLHQCTKTGDTDPLFPITTLLYELAWKWGAALVLACPTLCGTSTHGELGQGNWAAVFSACSARVGAGWGKGEWSSQPCPCGTEFLQHGGGGGGWMGMRNTRGLLLHDQTAALG